MKRLVVSTLFLTAVVCLATAQQLNNYWVDHRVKKFVDMAINRANQQFDYGHLNFEEIGGAQQVDPRQVKIDVRLRVTTCRKASGGEPHRHRPECPFKRLQVRCLVCSPDPDTNNPFIDCVRKRDENTRHAVWDENCQPKPLPGSLSLNSAPPGVDSRSLTISLFTGRFVLDQATPAKPGLKPPPRPPPILQGLRPIISVFPSMNGVSEGEQQGRLQVFKGSNFTISCSFHQQHPHSSFHLQFHDGSTVTYSHTQPCVNRSADFLFYAADHAHQGKYWCVYGIVLINGTFITMTASSAVVADDHRAADDHVVTYDYDATDADVVTDDRVVTEDVTAGHQSSFVWSPSIFLSVTENEGA